MRRLKFIVPIVVVVWLGAAWFFLVRNPAPPYQTTTVSRGDITEEAFARGNVESSGAAKLSFRQGGTLATLNVDVGQTVVPGETLASLDTAALEANYNAARAALAKAGAALDKAIAGTRSEDIAVTAAAKESASVALANKEKDLAQSIQETLTSLDNILGTDVDQLFTNPETAPLYGVTIESGTTKYQITTDSSETIAINNLRKTVGNDLAAFSDSISADDELLVQSEKAQNALDDMAALLLHIANTINDYTGLDTTAQTIYQGYQSDIGTARTTTENDRQSLLSALTAYQSALSSLEEADSQLALKAAPSRPEDIAASKATVEAAHANVDAAAAALRDARIIAPFAGTVTDTEGEVGEVISPQTAVVSLMPNEELDVKLNVSEDNIVGIRVGNRVRMELDAFPSGTEFYGTVSKVDPAETVIGGAIYYQTTVRFDTSNPDIRPGMTVNAWVETDHATSTLLIPASAITTADGSSTVRVLGSGNPIAKKVTTGIEGQNGMVEIIDGLTEGEKIITGE